MSTAVISALGRLVDFLACEYSAVIDDETDSPRYTWILPL
jgi:hypothetical protein